MALCCPSNNQASIAQAAAVASSRRAYRCGRRTHRILRRFTICVASLLMGLFLTTQLDAAIVSVDMRDANSPPRPEVPNPSGAVAPLVPIDFTFFALSKYG